MPVVNATIAAIFEEIADLLEIEGANPFRIRAYRNAARTLGELGTDVRTFIARGKPLTDIPGIGDDLSRKILEIVETGRSLALERLRQEVPPAVTELLRIPGLGPKRVRALWHELDVQTPEQLERAARDGRIRTLHGFGPKTEARVLEALRVHAAEPPRYKLSVAAQYAGALLEHLRGADGFVRAEVAGSYFGTDETVGDLDIVAAARPASEVMARFVRYEDVREVVSAGSTRATVILASGIQADLRVVDEASFGAALQYFTGSKAHNIAVRRIAQERGLKLNEYGVFRQAQRIAGDTEASVYAALGLPWIPPELREDRGEIEAARAGTLPRLVELKDLKGDLHSHTRWSDGHDTLEAMARAAQARGLEYLAITEHSRRLAIAHGLDAVRLGRQADEIRRLNGTLSGITLLSGIETDILEDGTLDLPDVALAKLDLVVAAVHSHFGLSRTQQTERILKALDNPHVRILAHPTGRLIGEREPYDADMHRVIRKAAARGVALELNAHPQRLDLLDTHCQLAKAEGALVAIDSDAHSAFELDGLRFGVGQARRGWLEAGDVLNTRSLRELRALWRRTKTAAN